ncbi:MAG: hypothetical protein QXO69_03620 [archaeon]
MKLKRHLRSIFFGVLFGFTYAVITKNAYPWLITGIAFAGVLVPNLDINFMTKLSRTPASIVVNLFMIPFLIILIIPAVYVSAFFIGYYGHVINDLDKKNNLEFAKQRAFTGVLWMFAIVVIMAVFHLNFNQTMRLFQGVYVI